MIPLFSLSKQNKSLNKQLTQSLQEVIDGGVFILGKRVEEFERVFAKYIGVQYAVGVASGTDALTLALLALDVGRGDEVIIPANSYPTVFAVSATGADPKLVDVDPEFYTLNPNLVTQAITNRTKAIIPVHLYGQSADMEKIMEIGKKFGIPVVEDCAQGHGAKYKIKHFHPKTGSSYCWKKVGSMGEMGCFSFYPTKNLGCFGDGGMVVTNNTDFYHKLKLLRMYGEKERYQSMIRGRNSRLDEMQASILLLKLKYLDGWIEKRKLIAGKYTKGINNSLLKSPKEAAYSSHVYHLFVIRSQKRNELKDYLEAQGIQTGIHYPKPIYKQPSYAYLNLSGGNFPVTEALSSEILSLPVYPELTNEETDKIIETINAFRI